jgi:peptide/nickel transport system ATP-binding protein
MVCVTSSIPGSGGETADNHVVLRVEGLKTYFHTYEGTVRALENIDFKVRAGEVVGLVGETGCGKSVTALSILRLIPSPPGNIEGGRVFLDEPEEVYTLRAEYDRIAFERLRRKGASRNISSLQAKEVLQPEIKLLQSKLQASNSEKEKADLKLRLQAATSEYDILQKSMEDIQRIRGAKISMIFQEPMTALNPVFTVGNQIAEMLILHRKMDLCQSALKALDLQMAARAKKIRGKRLTAAQGRTAFLAGRDLDGLPKEERAIHDRLQEMKDDDCVCSVCWSSASILWDCCPACGARLTFDLLAPFRGGIMSLEKRLYSRVLKDPQDRLVDFVNSMPIFRRLVHTRLENEASHWAVNSLREVEISEPERIAGQYPFELSGGMRQRAMIAMMMACNPELLIADEPTTALDVTVEAQILKLMKNLQAKTNMAILLITHDLGIVAEICDKVGVMYAGNIVEFGTTEQVFHRMLHPYTKGLMQSIPRFKAASSQERKKDLPVIPGTVPNLLYPPSGCRFHPRCPMASPLCSEANPELKEIEPGHFVACYTHVLRGEAPP